MFEHQTWYLLDDGAAVDPDAVAPDAAGVLRTESGLAVALRADGTPKSTGAPAGRTAFASLEPERPKTYKTREVKARGARKATAG